MILPVPWHNGIHGYDIQGRKPDAKYIAIINEQTAPAYSTLTTGEESEGSL